MTFCLQREGGGGVGGTEQARLVRERERERERQRERERKGEGGSLQGVSLVSSINKGSDGLSASNSGRVGAHKRNLEGEDEPLICPPRLCLKPGTHTPVLTPRPPPLSAYYGRNATSSADFSLSLSPRPPLPPPSPSLFLLLYALRCVSFACLVSAATIRHDDKEEKGQSFGSRLKRWSVCKTSWTRRQSEAVS